MRTIRAMCLAAFAGVLPILGSCVEGDRPPSGSVGGVSETGVAEGTCDASKAQRYDGSSFEEVGQANLRRATGAESVRPVRPDEVVTMEYDPDRLTVRIDSDGRIESSSCG